MTTKNRNLQSKLIRGRASASSLGNVFWISLLTAAFCNLTVFANSEDAVPASGESATAQKIASETPGLAAQSSTTNHSPDAGIKAVTSLEFEGYGTPASG